MGRLPRIASSAASRLRAKHSVFWPPSHVANPHPITLPLREFHSLVQPFLSGFHRRFPSFRPFSGISDVDDSRAEALEKLRGMVDAWINIQNDGEFIFEDESKIDDGSSSKNATKLLSTFGLVDEWNLEDWKETEVDMVREGTKNLALGFNGEDVQGEFRRKQEGKTQPTPKAKKVFGMDEGLPPRVLVEFCESTSLADLADSDVNKLFNLRLAVSLISIFFFVHEENIYPWTLAVVDIIDIFSLQIHVFLLHNSMPMNTLNHEYLPAFSPENKH